MKKSLLTIALLSILVSALAVQPAVSQGFKTVLERVDKLEARLAALEQNGTGKTTADFSAVRAELLKQIREVREAVNSLAARTATAEERSVLLETQVEQLEQNLSAFDAKKVSALSNTAESRDSELTVELKGLLGDLKKAVATVEKNGAAEGNTPPAPVPNVVMADDFKMRLYGFVKVEAFYDNAEVAKGDWLLFAYPGSHANAEQDIYSMNARHTRLGMQIDGPAVGSDGQVKGLVEIDFAGGFPNSSTAVRQPQLRLRHAWVELNYPMWEARFGQDWALISGPFPNTTSFVVGAGKGNLWMRYPQIKLTRKFSTSKFAVSVNRPMAGNVKYEDFAGGDFDFVGDGERSGMPWVMARLWFNAGSAALSVSGHYGKEQIADLSDNTHDVETYSVNADAVIPAGPAQITARAFYGENLNSFFGGVFQGFKKEAGAVRNIETRGGWAQLKYTVNPQWSWTVGGGLDDPVNDYLGSGSRERNDWLFGNLAWSIAKPVIFMLEYERLETSYIDDEAGVNNRIQFVTYYKF